MERQEGVTAVEERPNASEEAPAPPAPDALDDEDEGQEYEFEFETPFGKIEFEVEPRKLFEKKEQQRKEKAEREAAKKARAEARRLKSLGGGPGSEIVIVKRSNWLPILTVFVLVVVGVAIAYWLFGRPDETDDDVPAEFLTEEAAIAANAVAPTSGIFGRIKHAVREGRRASKQAQDEQLRKFKEASKS